MGILAYILNMHSYSNSYELRPKIKGTLLVRMVVGATWSRATRLDTPPTRGNNPPFTAWS